MKQGSKESSNNVCKLCYKDAEDMIHFITGCGKRPRDTDNMIRDLQEMYEAGNLIPPSSGTEVTFTVLNLKKEKWPIKNSQKDCRNAIGIFCNHGLTMVTILL